MTVTLDENDCSTGSEHIILYYGFESYQMCCVEKKNKIEERDASTKNEKYRSRFEKTKKRGEPLLYVNIYV